MRFTNLDFATNRSEFRLLLRRPGKQRAHRQQECHWYANQELFQIPLHRVESWFLYAASVSSVSLWCVLVQNSLATETRRTQRLHREELNPIPTNSGVGGRCVFFHRPSGLSLVSSILQPGVSYSVRPISIDCLRGT